jgi:hypothetical protein
VGGLFTEQAPDGWMVWSVGTANNTDGAVGTDGREQMSLAQPDTERVTLHVSEHWFFWHGWS